MRPYSIKKARDQMWDPSPSSRLRMTASDECTVNCRDRIYHSPVTDHYSLFRLFPHRSRFLTFACAQVIELGPAGPAFFFHFHFRNARRMHREHALDSLAVGNPADGE